VCRCWISGLGSACLYVGVRVSWATHVCVRAVD